MRAGVYIVVIDGEASVKRLERGPRRRLVVQSDNPVYATIEIGPRDATEVSIAGRVRAVWRSV